MTAKHRITVNLDDAEYAALQRIAASTDRSLAWLGRRAICDFIDQHTSADPLLFAGMMTAETPTRKSVP